MSGMIPLELQEQNKLLCDLLIDEFLKYRLAPRQFWTLVGLARASLGQGQDRVPLQFPMLQQVCRSPSKDLRDVVATLIDAKVLLAEWGWLPQGVQAWFYQIDPDITGWAQAAEKHRLKRLWDEQTFDEYGNVVLDSWDGVMQSVRNFAGWTQPEFLASELPSLSAAVARVIAAEGFRRLAHPVASGAEWKAQASRSGSVCMAVGSVAHVSDQETGLDVEPRRGAQIEPGPCAAVAPMLPSAYAGEGKPAIRVPEEAPARQELPARSSGGGATRDSGGGPESRAGEIAKESDPPELRAGVAHSSEESEPHSSEYSYGMRALKQRVMEVRGFGDAAGWPEAAKKELLELARQLGGGSFKHPRGDFFAWWKNRIWTKRGQPLPSGKPAPGAAGCAKALQQAVSEGLENRRQPGSKLLALASHIVDDRPPKKPEVRW